MSAESRTAPSRQLALELPHRPAMGREDFLVADGNAAAVAWIDRWPDWPAPALCLYGPSGAGKSHLLEVWRARSGAVAVTGAALVAAEVPALAAAGRVAVDDAAAIADEIALLQLFNLVKEAGGHLLLAARQAPAHWPLRLADLRSRLNAMPAVGIAAPDDVLLTALLAKLFADRQLLVGGDVLAYLVKRMERSFSAARRLVAELDRTALSEGQPVTVPLVRRVLAASERSGDAE